MASTTITGHPGNLNAALADTLGVVTSVTAQAGQTTTATLAPLGDADKTRAVQIPVADGTVFVDFRPFVSPDTRNPAWAGVEVLLRKRDASGQYPISYLLDMHPSQSFAHPGLGVGETWEVPGTGLAVTVSAIDGNASATVTVAPVNHFPVGSLDAVWSSSSSVSVAGWALDPDTADPILVHVYVDGRAVTAATAGLSRPDVAAALGTGADHGFLVEVPASAGAHQVCAYAINVPSGGNPSLGCRSVTAAS